MAYIVGSTSLSRWSSGSWTPCVTCTRPWPSHRSQRGQTRWNPPKSLSRGRSASRPPCVTCTRTWHSLRLSVPTTPGASSTGSQRRRTGWTSQCPSCPATLTRRSEVWPRGILSSTPSNQRTQKVPFFICWSHIVARWRCRTSFDDDRINQQSMRIVWCFKNLNMCGEVDLPNSYLLVINMS